MALRAWTSKPDLSQNVLHFLQTLLRDYHPRDFTVELWDGTRLDPEAGQFNVFTWRINQPAGLRAAISHANQVTLAEAYINGEFDVDGDITAVFPLGDYLLNKRWSTAEKLRLGAMLLALPSSKSSHVERPGTKLHGRAHSKDRDRKAVTYHYDLSNEFYSLWLGEEMVYSCAYFKTSEDDIDSAQRQKLDYICRKLRLQPGERLLDIGCGWGGLIIHAARNYGVHAVGITLSEQQYQLATERIQEAGVAERCQVKLLDYRDLDEAAAYDKLVSVGMVEHVGEGMLPAYFRQAYRLLRPGGVFLNHGIGRAGNRSRPERPTFTDVYVFPDGDLVPIGTMLQAAEEQGFEVRDVENLREHYALTLSRWLRQLEDHADRAREIAGEVKYRIWRLYLAGSMYYFQTGRLDLCQSLLVKSQNGRSGMPLRRDDWYTG